MMLTRAQTATSCIDTSLIIRIQRWNSTENHSINLPSPSLFLFARFPSERIRDERRNSCRNSSFTFSETTRISPPFRDVSHWKNSTRNLRDELIRGKNFGIFLPLIIGEKNSRISSVLRSGEDCLKSRGDFGQILHFAMKFMHSLSLLLMHDSCQRWPVVNCSKSRSRALSGIGVFRFSRYNLRIQEQQEKNNDLHFKLGACNSKFMKRCNPERDYK